MKACPFCGENIQDAAIVCKHCGRGGTGASISWLRIALLLLALVVVVPLLSLMFGIYGFVTAVVFTVLVAVAK